MKSVCSILFFLFFFQIQSHSQNLNGYKYVYVPILKYKDGSTDRWGISSKIINQFKTKGFYVCTGDIENCSYLKSIRENPCEYLRCEITHTNVVSGTNHVTVSLKNCKDQYVYNKKGSAMGWSLQDDYNKASSRAMNDIKYMNYKFNSNYTPEIVYPVVEKVNENEESLISYYDNNDIDDIEGIYKYISGLNNDNQYKIAIKKYSYKYKGIILEASSSIWKEGEIKFVLEPTAVQSIFTCKYFMGNKTSIETLGNMSNIAMLELELPKPNSNEKRKVTFLKLYPTNLISSNNGKNKSSNNNLNKIESEWKGNGSGIIISKDGYLVTNNHVVEDMNDFEVEFKYAQEIRSFHAKVVKKDPTNDLAILKIDDQNFKDFSSIPYNFYTRSADVGTEVFALGYPMALSVMGKDIKFTDGRISSKTGYMGNITTYQTTTPIQPGNSGGPLFDHKANLLGINSSGLRKDVADNVSYTIKTNYLVNLIDVLPKTIPLPSSTWIASKPLTEQIKILSNYVVLIKVR